jgi:mannose-1-phosphate guanylyltransferase
MNEPKTYCVIMAGGIGSRFWPMSRSAHPKQFLDFLGLGRTLLQQTYDRFLALCPPANILVVTNEQYSGLVREQLPDLPPERILSEPARRNTAPCVAYAAHVVDKLDPDALMVVAPSDHLVMKEDAFHETLRLALRTASEGDHLVTLGIMPNRPDTGYGYIQFTEQPGARHPRVKKVRTFTEKPDHDTAVRFLESGEFLWNSGLFVWSVKSVRKALREHLPDIDARFAEGRNVYGSAGEQDFVRQVYAECESISVDYGIMEKADNVLTVVSDFGWSDLGTWGSLYTHLSKDTADNAVVGGEARLYDCARNMVHVHDGRTLVLQGLEDFIVVSTPDTLLVCRKQDEQRIRQFVNDLTAEGRDDLI